MSHYSRVKTSLTDMDCLVEALKDLGYKSVEVHSEPAGLYGYQGDLRRETAHVIVRRKHVGTVSNDLGFFRGPNGTFEAIISDYDRSQGLNAAWMTRLLRSYGKHAVIAFAKAGGYSMNEVTHSKSDETRIVLRRMS